MDKTKNDENEQNTGIIPVLEKPSWRRWLWEHNGLKTLLRFAAFIIVLLAVLSNDARISKYLALIFQGL